jgi:hypothetical protein
MIILIETNIVNLLEEKPKSSKIEDLTNGLILINHLKTLLKPEDKDKEHSRIRIFKNPYKVVYVIKGDKTIIPENALDTSLIDNLINELNSL